MKLLFCFLYELYLHSNRLFEINFVEFFFYGYQYKLGEKGSKIREKLKEFRN